MRQCLTEVNGRHLDMKSEVTADGVLFTGTECEIDYLSTHKHQHGRIPRGPHDDSSWCISRQDEALSFCACMDRAGRTDESGDCWYVERDDRSLRVLGTAGEKLALFQRPSNEFEAWHGHPRGHRGQKDYPPVAVLRGLKDGGAITNVEYARMIQGDIP